jgi:hypothetical protein
MIQKAKEIIRQLKELFRPIPAPVLIPVKEQARARKEAIRKLRATLARR